MFFFVLFIIGVVIYCYNHDKEYNKSYDKFKAESGKKFEEWYNSPEGKAEMEYSSKYIAASVAAEALAKRKNHCYGCKNRIIFDLSYKEHVLYRVCNKCKWIKCDNCKRCGCGYSRY